MFISTTAPKLQNFDPTKSGQFELPPLGIYNEQFKVANLEEGQTKKGDGKLDITFEILTGSIQGFRFTLSYNVGNSKQQTAEWAVQDVMRIGYGVTGNKNYGRDAGGFDTNDLYNNAFGATLTVVDSKNQKDDGTFFPEASFTKITPIEQPNNQANNQANSMSQQAGNSSQPQPAPAQNNNQQPAQPPPQQPAQAAATAWGKQ